MKKTKADKRIEAYVDEGISYDIDRLIEIGLDDDEMDKVINHGMDLTDKQCVKIVKALGLDSNLVSVDIEMPDFEDDEDSIVVGMKEGDYLLGSMISYLRDAEHLVDGMVKQGLPIYRVKLHHISVPNLCHELAHIKVDGHGGDFEAEEDRLLTLACNLVLK